VKRLLVVVFLVLVASSGYRFYGSPQTGTGSLTLPQPSPNESEKAPSFEAADREGGSFELSDKGVYVLTFWSSSSLPFLTNKDTAEARPEFERMAREYADEGVSFAAVYVSSPPASEKDVPYAVLGDGSGELTAMYNVKRVPRLFLISDGEIRLVQNGHYSENEERLREELDLILQDAA
jgi:peroxiredoxin